MKLIRFIIILIKSIMEFELSLILVFNPFGKLGYRIFILGRQIEFMSKCKSKKSIIIKNIYVTTDLVKRTLLATINIV